ncbi:histidine phosphatase family protein [Agromyces sp. NPDC058110]|uniref:histidine phosphatase family protein n=1 Tax=Agromyces sp. NPDC058110 TaxID=3346345 RepID=UPI0036D7A468
MTDAVPLTAATTRLALVRHGETDWNVQRRIQGATDIPLNDAGREQAVAVASRLDGVSWTAVYASTLSRAAETAEIISAERGLPDPVQVAALAERSYGVLEGLDHGGRAAVEARAETVDGLEPRSAVIARARAALLEIADAHPGGDVVVVTHGGVIHALMLDLSGRTFPTPEYVIGNGSVHDVIAADGRLSLVMPEAAVGTHG